MASIKIHNRLTHGLGKTPVLVIGFDQYHDFDGVLLDEMGGFDSLPQFEWVTIKLDVSPVGGLHYSLTGFGRQVTKNGTVEGRTVFDTRLDPFDPFD
jgi:hypothetical protein